MTEITIPLARTSLNKAWLILRNALRSNIKRRRPRIPSCISTMSKSLLPPAETSFQNRRSFPVARCSSRREAVYMGAPPTCQMPFERKMTKVTFFSKWLATAPLAIRRTRRNQRFTPFKPTLYIRKALSIHEDMKSKQYLNHHFAIVSVELKRNRLTAYTYHLTSGHCVVSHSVLSSNCERRGKGKH